VRLRGKHLVAFLCAIVIALVAYGIVRSHWLSTSGSKDFLDEARRLADQAPPAQDRGTQPPVTGEASDVPQMVVEPTGLLDVGVIPNEGIFHCEIKVHNRGGALLEITRVSSTCGCTHASIDQAAKKIPPGGASTINIAIDPARIHGFESNKTVTIMSNDPKNARADVAVLAKIDPEFQIDPPELDLGEVPKGTPCERTILFRQLADEPITIAEVTQEDQRNSFVISFEKRPETEWVTPGKAEYLIAVKVDEEASPGSLNTSLTIASTCKRLQKFRYPVKGVVTSFYKVDPQVVFLVRDPSPKKTETSKTITITADRPFEIADLRPSLDGLLAVARPGTVPNSAAIELTLKPDVGAPGRRNATLAFTIKSGQEALKERVNVRIMSPQFSAPPARLPSAPRPSPAQRKETPLPEKPPTG